MGQDPEDDREYTAKGADRLERWYSRIPNLIDDLGLSPYAFRLYAHIKRVAGDDGLCYQSRNTMAKTCSMSTGQVTSAKQELVDARLINITRAQAGYHSDVIKIIDIWERNFAVYSNITQSGSDRVNEESAPRSGGDLTRSGGDLTRSGGDLTRSGGDIKNNSLRKTPKEDIPVEFNKTEELPPGEKILNQLKEQLRFQMNDFVGWQRKIQPLHFVEWDGKILKVGSENENSIFWLNNRGKSTIDKVLAGIVDDDSVAVEFALIDGNYHYG